MINAKAIVGSHHILFVTLDTLRYDVTVDCLDRGVTPNFAAILPERKWEERHSPGNFTYAAHQAFFAGFLPTPAMPGKHPRLFAMEFPGSETTGPETWVFHTPDLVTGLAANGYHTLCIGGVGFFNKLTPLGNALPSLFLESHWSPDLGVTDPHSFENQIHVTAQALERLDPQKRVFLFVNVSAIHQPNRFYLPGATEDTIHSHAAALQYVDHHFPKLLSLIQKRGPVLCIICSDHGTAYGENGYQGHRLCHPVVWTVPYAEMILS